MDNSNPNLIVPLHNLIDEEYRGFVLKAKQVEDGLWLAFGQTRPEAQPHGVGEMKLTGQGASKREAVKDLHDNIDLYRKSVKERSIIMGN